MQRRITNWESDSENGPSHYTIECKHRRETPFLASNVALLVACVSPPGSSTFLIGKSTAARVTLEQYILLAAVSWISYPGPFFLRDDETKIWAYKLWLGASQLLFESPHQSTATSGQHSAPTACVILSCHCCSQLRVHLPPPMRACPIPTNAPPP